MSKSPNAKRVIPILVFKGAVKAIEHYKKAFGAEEMYRMTYPDSDLIAHAGIKIGDTEVFVSDEREDMCSKASAPQAFYLYLPDADAAMKKAVQAGCTEDQPVTDMFWGDRMGTVTDPFGMKWMIGTHVRDVSEDEMKEAMKKMGKAA